MGNVIDLFPQTSDILETPMTSNHSIGDVAYFEPSISNIDSITMQPLNQDLCCLCKIVGIKFIAGKVLYDIVVPVKVNSDSIEWYEVRPIRDVDSYFILKYDIK